VPMETVASGLPARHRMPSASSALRQAGHSAAERFQSLSEHAARGHPTSIPFRRRGQVKNPGAVMRRLVPSAMARSHGTICAGFLTA
jgi:hypothetical protein